MLPVVTDFIAAIDVTGSRPGEFFFSLTLSSYDTSHPVKVTFYADKNRSGKFEAGRDARLSDGTFVSPSQADPASRFAGSCLTSLIPPGTGRFYAVISAGKGKPAVYTDESLSVLTPLPGKSSVVASILPHIDAPVGANSTFPVDITVVNPSPKRAKFNETVTLYYKPFGPAGPTPITQVPIKINLKPHGATTFTYQLHLPADVPATRFQLLAATSTVPGNLANYSDPFTGPAYEAISFSFDSTFQALATIEASQRTFIAITLRNSGSVTTSATGPLSLFATDASGNRLLLLAQQNLSETTQPGEERIITLEIPAGFIPTTLISAHLEATFNGSTVATTFEAIRFLH